MRAEILLLVLAAVLQQPRPARAYIRKNGGDLWSKSKQRGLNKVDGRKKVHTSDLFPWLWRPDYTEVEPLNAPRDVRECLPRKGTRKDTCGQSMICECIDTPVLNHLQVIKPPCSQPPPA